MFYSDDGLSFGSIDEVFLEALELLGESLPRDARALLDTFRDSHYEQFAPDEGAEFDADVDDEREAVRRDHVLASTVADEAISLIDAGLIVDAARRCETIARPKWQSLTECEENYAAAMVPPPVVAPQFVQAAFQI